VGKKDKPGMNSGWLKAENRFGVLYNNGARERR